MANQAASLMGCAGAALISGAHHKSTRKSTLVTWSLVDLGAAKLIALLDLLGISLDAGTRQGHQHALPSVSQSASVSYKTVLDPDVLAAALVDGANNPH